MAQQCDAQSLVNSAYSNWGNLPPGYYFPIAIELASKIAKVSSDPSSLIASCNELCIPPGYELPVAIAMACDALGSVFTPTNSEVTAFAAAAGITDPATLTALDALVTGLKKSTAWTQLDAVYPFVGGTSTTCSYNLIDPSKYRITWNGAVSFDTTGIIGGGGYGDTGFVPSGAGGNFSLNSGSIGVYNRVSIGTAGIFMGGSSALGLDQTGLITAGFGPFNLFGRVNQIGGVTPIAGAATNGNLVVSRTASNVESTYAADGATVTTADATSAATAFSIFVLASNQGGTPASNMSVNLAFAFIGAGFNAGIVALIESAITTFNTTLGRA